MVDITLAIPEELHKVVKQHKEIRWSDIAREATWDYARKIELLDKITAKSKFTKEDIMEIDAKIKKDLFKHYAK
ncbi:MAG: hypothetical protein U9O96_06935 [Candidatus Thermoplasmatota archaeon]|nr:hypothetical protein [Candidatus Thermoplasmatota archaeon]